MSIARRLRDSRFVDELKILATFLPAVARAGRKDDLVAAIQRTPARQRQPVRATVGAVLVPVPGRLSAQPADRPARAFALRRARACRDPSLPPLETLTDGIGGEPLTVRCIEHEAADMPVLLRLRLTDQGKLQISDKTPQPGAATLRLPATS